MTVLILTRPNDYHAQAVKWAIQRLGGSCEIFYSLDLCDGAGWSFNPAADVLRIDYRGKRDVLDFNKFRSVWMRRPGSVYPQESIEDTKERAVSESESAIFASSIIRRMEADRFVVNPIDQTRLASAKPVQLAVAVRVGLPVPRTLVSNSRDEVIEFFHACGGKIVYKTMTPAVWTVQENKAMTVPTTMLTDTDLLLRADISRSPSIFQELITKKIEVRATIMGRSIFAWEKSFPTRESLDVDWRFMYDNAEHKVHYLPTAISEKCFRLMDELGLVFGCFDFVIDEHGEYHFLEVNPQGQWLWGDGLDIGLYQLEAMAEFLLSGAADFKYSDSRRFKISDFSADDYQLAREHESREHFGDLTTFIYERVSVPMFKLKLLNAPEFSVALSGQE